MIIKLKKNCTKTQLLLLFQKLKKFKVHISMICTSYNISMKKCIELIENESIQDYKHNIINEYLNIYIKAWIGTDILIKIE